MYLLKPTRQTHKRYKRTFTFHYVSIKTNSTLKNIARHYYLHSTMYLLKLPDEPDELLSSVFTFHYVSIKTRTPAAQQHRHNKFTFHYVSIKTHSPALISFSCLYLHSTMYLSLIHISEPTRRS